MSKTQLMNTHDLSWEMSPLCNVLIGFKNQTRHLTRSAYLSFPVREQSEICKLLLSLSTKKFNQDQLDNFSDKIIEQLIEYKFFMPRKSFTFMQFIKHRLNLLNENRNVSLWYKGTEYLVTSFCFMAFYKQQPGGYIKEKVILPRWFKKISSLTYDLITNANSLEKFDSYSAKIKDKLQKYGLVLKKTDAVHHEQFFVENCQLSTKFINALPPHYEGLLPSKVTNISDYEINTNVFFLDNAKELPDQLLASKTLSSWILSTKPSVMIVNPVTNVSSIFWLTDEQMSILKKIYRSKIINNNINEETLYLFNCIYILYTEEQLQALHADWKSKQAQAKQQLEDDQYMQINSILAPFDFAIARLYIRYMDEGKFLIRDKANGKTKGRYWIHRDNYVFYLQTQLNTIFNQLVNEPVKIGHNALTVYEEGSNLPIHRDDVLAFRWVFSLPIETTPYRDRDQAWPIYVDTGKKQVQANLRSGDGVFINPQMPHWRHTLTDHKLNIVFCWFVPKSYQGFVNGHWID